MATRKKQATDPLNLTGLHASTSYANRSAQAAGKLAQKPGDSLTTNQGLRISDN